MVESFEEIVELSLLFDFYGEMLGEHKKKIFEDYVLNDLSLAEIAEEEGISRQGVHDIVKRCTKQLKEYETTLHLVEKFQNMKNKLTEASALLGNPNIIKTSLNYLSNPTTFFCGISLSSGSPRSAPSLSFLSISRRTSTSASLLIFS